MFLHPLEPRRARSYRTTLALLAECRALAPREFAWRKPPYEYEFIKPPIDILCGTSDVREAIEAGLSVRRFKDQFESEARAFEVIRRPYLMYA